MTSHNHFVKMDNQNTLRQKPILILPEEKSILSDLANSCEYLTVDKSCLVVLENQKAKSNRNIRCQNEDKSACCYLCIFRQGCAISCNYLGQTSEASQSETSEKETETDSTTRTEADKTDAPIAYCPLCNFEMAQTKTKFETENWRGPTPALNGEALPVLVYLCPKCGKIELQFDKNQ